MNSGTFSLVRSTSNEVRERPVHCTGYGKSAGGSRPLFRLIRSPEGLSRCFSASSAWELWADWASRAGAILVVGCGKVTNRTSDPIRSVRRLSLSPRTRDHLVRSGVSIIGANGRLIDVVCPSRGNEKERVPTTSSSQRGLDTRADGSLLGIDRLRLVCERVQSRR